MYLVFLSLVGYLCYLGKKYLDAYRRSWSFAHLPQPARDNIIQGHAPILYRARKKNKFLEVFVGWQKECGPTVFFFIGKRIINCFTTDPSILQTMAYDPARFEKDPRLPNRKTDGHIITGTSSILSANGMNWATKRKAMSQFFAKVNIPHLFDISKENLNGPLVTVWEKASKIGTRVDLHDLFAITFAGTMKTYGLQELPSAETVANYALEILDGIKIKDPGTFNIYKLMTDKRNGTPTQILVAKARGEVEAVVLKKMQTFNFEKDEPAKENLLEFLIHANYYMLKAEGKAMNYSDLASLVVSDIMTVILVTDNLTKQMCTLFMFLETNKPAQQRMFAELREVELKTVADLHKLVYTEQCMLEAMRMGPAITRGQRIYKVPKVGEENAGSLCGFRIPEKTVTMIFSEYLQHMNPQNWPNPDTFDPDRWAKDKPRPAPFSYVPFWTGPRVCIAKHVAMMLMKLTLSMIAKNFDIKQDFEAGEKPRVDQNVAPLKILGKITAFIQPVSAA